jgi:hypothetical protein
VDITVMNAHAMYKVKTGQNIPVVDFQIETVRQLIEKYMPQENPYAKRGRPSSQDMPIRLTARHFPEKIPSVPGGKKASRRI